MSIDDWVGVGIPEETLEQATVWITRLDSNNLDAEQQRVFARWLDADPMNRWAFEELSELWARVATLKDIRHLVDESQVLSFPQSKPIDEVPSTPMGPAWWQSATAIVLVVLGLMAPILTDEPKGSDHPVTHELWVANGD
jgi:ferric-dicitrate binding protein FerR (iron transport regulator)